MDTPPDLCEFLNNSTLIIPYKASSYKMGYIFFCILIQVIFLQIEAFYSIYIGIDYDLFHI